MRAHRWSKPRAVAIQRYSDAKCRINGKLAGDRKSKLWEGLEIADHDEFIDWTLKDPDFKTIYDEWAAAGFPRRLAPTTHRIDRSIGYTVDNIQWVRHAEKSRKHLADARARKKGMV